MAKNKITDYDTTAANNTDVGGIDIRGSANVRNHDDGQRMMMAHLARVNAGTDPLADTVAFADPANLTKQVRIDAGNVTAGQTRVLTMPDQNVTITAAGAAILDDADVAAQLATLSAVSYDAQALTAGQQTQVKDNISAVGYDAQTLTAGQQTQARENIGLGTGDNVSFSEIDALSDILFKGMSIKKILNITQNYDGSLYSTTSTTLYSANGPIAVNNYTPSSGTSKIIVISRSRSTAKWTGGASSSADFKSVGYLGYYDGTQYTLAPGGNYALTGIENVTMATNGENYSTWVAVAVLNQTHLRSDTGDWLARWMHSVAYANNTSELQYCGTIIVEFED